MIKEKTDWNNDYVIREMVEKYGIED